MRAAEANASEAPPQLGGKRVYRGPSSGVVCLFMRTTVGIKCMLFKASRVSSLRDERVLLLRLLVVTIEAMKV